jgi:polar amino acid transport system substrate-binding protein
VILILQRLCRHLYLPAPFRGGELRWAGDPEGDAAFVEAEPAQPEKIIGFDVEIAQLFARRLKPQSNFVNITFTSIDQSIRRGDADFGLSGIEDTQVRRETMTATVPTTGSANY